MEINLNFNIRIDIEVNYTDKAGHHRTINKRANSMVNGFIDILAANMTATAVTTGKDIGGTTRTITALAGNNLNSCGTIDDNINCGIVVGTSDTDVTTADYKLGQLIAQGVAGGHLIYELPTYFPPATVSTSRSFKISRNLINNSEGDITVKEVGIHSYGASTPYYFLIEHTLINFTIANNTEANITYTFTITAGGAGTWQVRGMADLLYALMSGVAYTGGLNISNGAATINPGAGTVIGGAGTVTQGIIVGRGSNAVTINDYALQTPCAQGTGANQVQYAVDTSTAPATVGSSRQFTIVRVLTGNTSGSVAITEVGLYTGSIMIDRQLNSFTLLQSPGIKTLTYTIKVTV